MNTEPSIFKVYPHDPLMIFNVASQRLSKACSATSRLKGKGATTVRAHETYSRFRSPLQSAGGELPIAATLELLSASLIKQAASDFLAAFKICIFLRSAFGKDLSSVISRTIPATSEPNSSSISAKLVGGQSSTVSCSQAAAMHSQSRPKL